jgi:lipoprotein-anchoring transpeptidase ErfK/SrfK
MALGGAATVTFLTLAGAMGFGPGAAMAESPAHQQASESGTADAGSKQSSSDGWLTIDDTPSSDPSSRPIGGVNGPGPSTELPAGSGTGKRVVYDVSDQRVWLVKSDDSVARTYLVSGAKKESLLPPGEYNVYSKSRHAVSLNHKETMNYMVRFAAGDHAAIGFHDVPAFGDGRLAQSREELGTPLSAGCIRAWISDARAMWEFTKVGTAVVVRA